MSALQRRLMLLLALFLVAQTDFSIAKYIGELQAGLWLGVTIWADYLAMTQLFGAFISAGYAGVRQLALGPYVSLDAAAAPAWLAALMQAAISIAVAAVVTSVFWQGRQAQDRRPARPAHGPAGHGDAARHPIRPVL
jgi:hypothetical protein